MTAAETDIVAEARALLRERIHDRPLMRREVDEEIARRLDDETRAAIRAWHRAWLYEAIEYRAAHPSTPAWLRDADAASADRAAWLQARAAEGDCGGMVIAVAGRSVWERISAACSVGEEAVSDIVYHLTHPRSEVPPC